MLVRSLALTDFRSYESLYLELGPGLTAILGDNGHGKTNLIEAIGFVAGQGSFRGAPDEALVRVGSDAAVIRCELEASDGRETLVECEISRVGRNRVKVNRQALRRARDLVGVLPITVFSPDDLGLVKGSPSSRRRWIDDVIGARSSGMERARAELERILRHRNALLRQARGRLVDDVAMTLDVWDSKLAAAGDTLREARLDLIDEIGPRLSRAYDSVAREPADVAATYASSWGEEPLAEALGRVRGEDLKRSVSTIGPHRDDVTFSVGGIPARTHASQGEQRSLALALRLAADALIRDSGAGDPVLLLDDVFSELDPGRAGALLEALPSAQSILTSAAGLPPAARPDRVLHIRDSSISEQP